MNRLDRLASILIQLQSKRVVRAQEIADRFDISLRTVYRDVRSLETAGIPVIGAAGVGYSIVEGYRLPPVQFTKDEAAAFLTAEKLVTQYTDTSVASLYQTGLLKIRSVLRLSEKDFIEQLDDAVQVHSNQQRTIPSSDQTLLVILRSIADKEVLSIHYSGQKDEKAHQRMIEPIGVFHKNNAWYVVAWCQLRQDIRNFRIDRMEKTARTNSFFEAHDLSLQEYLSATASGAPVLDACITVPREVLPYIEMQKNQQGFVSQTINGAHVDMRFQTQSYAYLARWMMQFADKIIAVDPPELEQTFRGILNNAQKKISP